MVSKDEGHYKHLVAEKIEAQAGLLARRISERFPDSSLLQVAMEMHEIALTCTRYRHAPANQRSGFLVRGKSAYTELSTVGAKCIST